MPKQVISIHCADMHLRQTAPVARSAEPDWFEAMGRYTKQLKELQNDYNGVPVFCSGDVFHKWNSTPELINWAIRNLPTMYCVPGQHDLPHHSYEFSRKSAYETLVLAGRIKNIEGMMLVNDMAVYGFGWTEDVWPPDLSSRTKVAIIHDYIWVNGKKYSGAPNEAKLEGWKNRLKGYDAAFFGDNHKGFVRKIGDCNVMNCGCLFPSNSDEIDYKPAVGLLFDDGSIERILLDTLQDKWLTDDVITGDRDDVKFARLLEELNSVVHDTGVDFTEAINKALKSSKSVSKLASQVVRSVMDTIENG